MSNQNGRSEGLMTDRAAGELIGTLDTARRCEQSSCPGWQGQKPLRSEGLAGSNFAWTLQPT